MPVTTSRHQSPVRAVGASERAAGRARGLGGAGGEAALRRRVWPGSFIFGRGDRREGLLSRSCAGPGKRPRRLGAAAGSLE